MNTYLFMKNDWLSELCHEFCLLLSFRFYRNVWMCICMIKIEKLQNESFNFWFYSTTEKMVNRTFNFLFDKRNL